MPEDKQITSVANKIVKECAKLQLKKYRENEILLEGKKAVDEAIAASLQIKYIFLSDKKLEAEYAGFSPFFVNDAVIKKLSTTSSPPNVIAVAKKPSYKLENFKNYKKIALLENIKDAGNLGTIIRASCAFNISGIMLFGDTTDEFSPKVIRAAAGNMFKIPIIKINERELLEFKKTHKIIASVVNSKCYFSKIHPNQKTIVMFGSEACGLSDKLINMADEKYTIKMTNNVESLNLALCAGIILYQMQ